MRRTRCRRRIKRRYFELIGQGWSGASAAEQVGVSLSCGSLWFIDAGRVSFVETSISPRYLSQDDRIEIADGHGRGEPVTQIAERIGKCHQTVYASWPGTEGRRTLSAVVRAQSGAPAPPPSQATQFAVEAGLREVVAGKLARHWSPAQISRWLRRPIPESAPKPLKSCC